MLLLQSWNLQTSWKLFSIIVIMCNVHCETLLCIFKVYRTVIHSLTFGTSQIITIILNNLQIVHMSQLCQILSKVSRTYDAHFISRNNIANNKFSRLKKSLNIGLNLQSTYQPCNKCLFNTEKKFGCRKQKLDSHNRTIVTKTQFLVFGNKPFFRKKIFFSLKD